MNQTEALLEHYIKQDAELRDQIVELQRMVARQSRTIEEVDAEREELQEAYEGVKEELKRAQQYIRMEEED
tara:strand:- start:520 stop:732 length:213 start_codon:yes stop_codon:yes gene_type:complete